MSTWAGAELSDLQWNWGEAYLISRPGPDVWLAQRQDTRETLKASTPEGLRELIIHDYAARPVSR